MVGLTGIVTVYNVLVHSHEHARTDLPYMKIRNKPFPWPCKYAFYLQHPLPCLSLAR